MKRDGDLVRHCGPEHVLVFAPTRSGKGIGTVVPTLLSWNASVLVYDIKKELWTLKGLAVVVLGTDESSWDSSSPALAKLLGRSV